VKKVECNQGIGDLEDLHCKIERGVQLRNSTLGIICIARLNAECKVLEFGYRYAFANLKV
jgi:hypothetical protein